LLGPGNAEGLPFPPDLRFPLRKGKQDMADHSPMRRRRINAHVEDAEKSLALVDLVQDLEGVLEGAGEPVETAHDQR
jgi:hypothetical protein